jgi:type II secretory pathway predicted ATPase ExeA
MMQLAVPRGFVMRRPSNLMSTTTAARPTPAPADPGPPSNYLDLYGLSKSPFGAGTDVAGYILFGSHRRAFELLVDHMMNGSGMILLTGDSGIGKTETLRAAAAVATESGLRTILVSRPQDGRISLEQIVADLDGQPETFFTPPRKALLADDLELMPHDCITLLLALSRPEPAEQGGSAIILSSSGVELSRPDLAEFSALSRNTVRLARLGPAEVRQYIERSLWIAGGTTRRLITPDAMKLVIAHSGGLPGAVNRLMEAAFTAGFARGDAMITAKTLGAVIGPVAPRSRPRPIREPSGVPARALQMAATGLLVAGVAVFLYKGLATKVAPERTIAARLPAEPSPPGNAPAVSPPASGPAPSSPPANATLSSAVIAALLNRGNEALGLGDIAAARLLFQRAAEAGNGVAATALGKTYDPNFTTNASARDPTRAAEWYRKAIALGDRNAADLLKRLTGS